MVNASPLLVPNDPKRSYDSFELANRLQVITVSDPETTVSAAAMDVGLGAMSDPKDLQGLAHFIEHMLFLGTEEFPKEGSYNTLLSEHGGMANAFTDAENTNYYFDVTCTHLKEVLQQFSAFFKCPLFTESATQRELMAIDSEHAKNTQQDFWRLYQFCKDVSSPDHPFSHFFTGNLKTLKEMPAKQGININERMRQHYNQYYSANRMKLAIYGKESNAVLKEWATELFSPILNKDVPRPVFEGRPYTPKELGYWHTVVPVMITRSLSLLFPLDQGYSSYRTSPYPYLLDLIGHESEGSILYHLKQLGWAEALCVDTAHETYDWSVMTIDVELSVAGLEHVEEVIEIVFEYIAMLKKAGFQQYVWDEIKSMKEVLFRYEVPTDPSSHVSMIACNMMKFPLEHALAAGIVCFDLDVPAIDRALDLMTPRNLLVILRAPEFEEECTQELSPYYSTRHNSRRITDEQLQRWASVVPRPELQLPVPNPFTPKDLALKDLAPGAPDTPQLMYRAGIPVWFKQDNKHFKPKALMQWDLLTRASYATPTDRLLTKLFVIVVSERLKALTYHAAMACLDFKFYSCRDGFHLQTFGLNDQLWALTQRCFGTIKNCDVEPDLFEMARARTKKAAANWAKVEPDQAALEVSACVTNVERWSNDDMLQIIDHITIKELEVFIQHVLKQVHVECFIHGNLTQDEALAMVDAGVADLLSPRMPDPSSRPDGRVIKVPKCTEFIIPVKGRDPDNANSVVISCNQVGLACPRNAVLCGAFIAITETPFWSQLRTWEQLGYVLNCWTGLDGAVMLISFLVQSPTHDPLYLYSRIYGFLEAITAFLEAYAEEDFAQVIASMIAKREEKPLSLEVEAGQYLWEVSSREYLWNRPQIEIEELRKLTKSDVITFFRTYLSNNAPERRRYTTLLYGQHHHGLYDALAPLALNQTAVTQVQTQLPRYVQRPLEEPAPNTPHSPTAASDANMPVLSSEPTTMIEGAAMVVPNGAVEGEMELEEGGNDARDPGLEEEGEDPEQKEEPVLEKAPLPSMEAFNAKVTTLDLHYVWNIATWQRTLRTWPVHTKLDPPAAASGSAPTLSASAPAMAPTLTATPAPSS